MKPLTRSFAAALLAFSTALTPTLASEQQQQLRRIEIWPEKPRDNQMMVVQETSPDHVKISMCSKFDGSRCERTLYFQGNENIPLFVIRALVKDLKAKPKSDLSTWETITGLAGLTAAIYGGRVSNKITTANTSVKYRLPLFSTWAGGFVDVEQTTLSQSEYIKRNFARYLSGLGVVISAVEAGVFLHRFHHAQLYLNAISLQLGYQPKGISIDFPITETFEELEDLLRNAEDHFT